MRHRPDPALFVDVLGWLTHEAELLDARSFREWLALLHPDVDYRMPAQVTVARGGAGAVPPIDHFAEDMFSLRKRVERLEGDHAWTEDPPSRTRRFVTNVRLAPGADGEVGVTSNLLLYRSRGDVRAADIVSASRDDLLVRGDGDWLLRSRHITVDEAVLRMQNLAVFL